jgi:PAS domain S-box-containing protein
MTTDADELAQTLFEEMGDAAFVVDPASMRLLDVNPMARRLTALPRDELLRTPLPDLIRSDAADALAHLRRALHTTQTFHSQEGFYLRRGADVWTPVNLTLTRLHTERRPLGLVLARDVTEQHAAREALRQANAELERRVRDRTQALEQLTLDLRTTVAELERRAAELQASEERFRLLVEGASDHAIIMLDPDGTVRTWNAGAERIYGFTAGEVIGRPFATLFLPADAAAGRPAEVLRRAAAAGVVKEEGWRARKGGGRFWANGTLTALDDAGGAVRGFANVTRDLTERIQAEWRVRDSEERLRTALAAGQMGTWVWEVGADRSHWDARECELLGMPPVDGPADTAEFFRLVHPDDLPELRRVLAEAVDRGTDFRAEFRVVRPDGRVVWLAGAGRVFRDAGGGPARMYGVNFDITDRVLAEDRVRRSEEQFRAFMDHSPAAAWITDADGRMVYLSAAYRRLVYLPAGDPIGKTLAEVYPDHDVRQHMAHIREVAATGRAIEATEPGARADGTPGEFLVYRFLLPDHGQQLVGGVAIDVTARKEAAETQARLEAQLRQSQKMEAVGRLAGGIAHDFNNLLTVITGYAELLLARLPAADPNREAVAEIQKAGGRAAALTRQLLAFSRRQVVEPRVLQLNALVADTEKMLRRLIGEHVLLSTSLDPAAGPVRADPGQLEQVLINLAVNARDAMPGGGRLTVETRAVTVGDEFRRDRPDVPAGEYVRLTVTDTGTGMDAATQARMFEPFFTTKPVGQGTGLGLATVHGIVQQAGGHVAVTSAVGRGTAVAVYLQRVADPPTAGKSHPVLPALPGGAETVLLVEDETAVRALGRQVLEGYGYTVLEAADGRVALAVATAHPGPIHLLISDVVMPHVGGRELAERLTATRPGCKLLLLSGYTDDAVVRHGVQAAEVAFLQKPFSPTALVRKVREVLDGAG